jgi:hypothetical protein
MLRFFREDASFVARHPGFVFGGFWCPFFILANAILSAIGQPKNPHDISVVILTVLVTCLLVEMYGVFYRRFFPPQAEPETE